MLLPFTASLIVFIILYIPYNLYWSFHQTHIFGTTFWDSYIYSTVISASFLALQFPAYLIAAIVTVRIRGRHRGGVCLISGVLLWALTFFAPDLRILPDTMPRWFLYTVGFPLLASSLQWLPEPKKKSIEQAGPAYPPQGVGSADS